MSDEKPFWESAPKMDPNESESSFLERVMGSKAFDIISQAKEARLEQQAGGPMTRAKRGNKIPLELLNMALGYTPERAEMIRRARRISTPSEERARRRSKDKVSRKARQRNQRIAALARRHRQKMTRRRTA